MICRQKGKYSSPEIITPTPVSQIQEFEKLFNKAINVFGWDGVKIHHISNQPLKIRRHNVLLIENAGKFHSPGSRTSTASSTIEASTKGASTSASAACTATQGRICWKPTYPTVEGLGRQQSGWRCRKRVKTSSPSRTTTSGFRFPSSFTRILRLSPPRLRGLSSISQRATLRGHSTMSLVVIATSWCGVMVRQNHQSNTAAPMQQSTS